MVYHFKMAELREENGELTAIVHTEIPQHLLNTEFSMEFIFQKSGDIESLRASAINFVKKQYPKAKIASIIITSGLTILASIPLEKAKAQETEFNMSYLAFGNTQTYISEVDKTQGNLNLVSPSYFGINSDGSLNISSQFDPILINEMHKRGIKVEPLLSNNWDRTIGRSALENRDQLSSQLADFIEKNNLDGIQVDIENVTEIDRDNYTDFVRLLREKIPSDKEISVAIAANPYGFTKGWQGSYDYKGLSQYADYLMLMAYDESFTGSPEGPVAGIDWVEKSIQYALNQGVSPEKIVLGIPFYGRYWKQGDTFGGKGISDTKVEEMLTKYGGTVNFDEKSQSSEAIITIKNGDPPTTVAGNTLTPGTYHIWYENNESIKAKFDLIQKYNLKGSGSWSLGQEDTSIWQYYQAWMSDNGGQNSPAAPTNLLDQTGVISPQGATTNYTVKSGDTLTKIALAFNMTVTQLKALNNLGSDTIRLGQVLKVNSTGNQTQQPKINRAPAVSSPAAGSAAPKAAVPQKPAAASPIYPTLKAGSKGAQVSDLQNKLRKIGIYKGKVDGIFGTATKNAVIAFQKKYKFTANGIATSQVLTKLNSLISKPAPKPIKKVYPTLNTGSKGSAVTDLQNRLKKIGIYKGKITGIFDRATKNAVIAFQKKYKLKADGISGPTTLSKLDAVTK